MTTQTQRTPGPFEIRPYNDNFAIVRTTGRIGHVATVIAEDDAAFIVRACNAHDDLVAAPDAYVDGAQEPALELAEIMGIVSTLTPGRQQAFRMVAVDGWNTNEAAEILGVSRQAVHTRYAAAMQAIAA